MMRSSTDLTCHALNYRPKCQPCRTCRGAASPCEDEEHPYEADDDCDEANTEEAGEPKLVGQRLVQCTQDLKWDG